MADGREREREDESEKKGREEEMSREKLFPLHIPTVFYSSILSSSSFPSYFYSSLSPKLYGPPDSKTNGIANSSIRKMK